MRRTKNMVILSLVLIMVSSVFLIWQENEYKTLSSQIYEKEVQIAKLSNQKLSLEAEIASNTTPEKIFAIAENQNIQLVLMPGKTSTVVASN